MKNLLEKSRTLNKLLQKTSGHPVDYTEMAKILGDLINANVYITGQDGCLLGHSLMDGFSCAMLLEAGSGEFVIGESSNEALLHIPRTVLNIHSTGEDCVLGGLAQKCAYGQRVSAVVPIILCGQRQGTLVLSKFGGETFSDEDTILAEYGAMVIGMEILRARSEKVEEEVRRKAAVQIAIGTLSYSEQEAITHIFAELNGKEALLVASKIADRVGITRSIIVNALRKFESAGVIETKSLGMKGTYIRVLNENLLEELERRQKNR